MTSPFLMFLLVVATGLCFLYLTPWPLFVWLGVCVCSWKFWRNQ